MVGRDLVLHLGPGQFMHAAFAGSRYQIVSVASRIQDVDVARAVSARVVRSVDEIPVSVCVRADT